MLDDVMSTPTDTVAPSIPLSIELATAWWEAAPSTRLITIHNQPIAPGEFDIPPSDPRLWSQLPHGATFMEGGRVANIIEPNDLRWGKRIVPREPHENGSDRWFELLPTYCVRIADSAAVSFPATNSSAFALHVWENGVDEIDQPTSGHGLVLGRLITPALLSDVALFLALTNEEKLQFLGISGQRLGDGIEHHSIKTTANTSDPDNPYFTIEDFSSRLGASGVTGADVTKTMLELKAVCALTTRRVAGETALDL